MEKALLLEAQKEPMLINFETFPFDITFQFFVPSLNTVRHEPRSEKR